jgi:hypothetical protein
VVVSAVRNAVSAATTTFTPISTIRFFIRTACLAPRDEDDLSCAFFAV